MPSFSQRNSPKTDRKPKKTEVFWVILGCFLWIIILNRIFTTFREQSVLSIQDILVEESQAVHHPTSLFESDSQR